MPRPDLLFWLCRRLDLPMERFFDQREDAIASLSEHQFGNMMRDMLRNQRFRIDPEAMPDGVHVQ